MQRSSVKIFEKFNKSCSSLSPKVLINGKKSLTNNESVPSTTTEEKCVYTEFFTLFICSFKSPMNDGIIIDNDDDDDDGSYDGDNRAFDEDDTQEDTDGM